MITTCTKCGAAYEAGSEEQANEPARLCFTCRKGIRTQWESTPATFSAVTKDYCGCGTCRSPIGYGKTEAEAVADLLDHLDDAAREVLA